VQKIYLGFQYSWVYVTQMTCKTDRIVRIIRYYKMTPSDFDYEYNIEESIASYYMIMTTLVIALIITCIIENT
jgi:hypothetical protein